VFWVEGGAVLLLGVAEGEEVGGEELEEEVDGGGARPDCSSAVGSSLDARSAARVFGGTSVSACSYISYSPARDASMSTAPIASSTMETAMAWLWL